MYQILYRKYRPTTFDEVVGQEVIVKTLKNAINNNSLNHAYLFTGPRGTGKTSIAKILAKTINCSNLSNCMPCNNCVSCTQINNKQSVDIIEIDAASNNGVDEIREIRNKVNLVPTVGKYKIYIVDEVHMLTTGAFNALLKTLEEPPNHIIFILATTEPHKIPATILSRCQRFDFQKINKVEMIKRLNLIIKQEKINANNEVLEEISRLSDGCMRDALSILDQVSAYTNGNITLENVHEINGTLPQLQLKNFIEDILNKDYDKIFSLISQFDTEGKNFIKLTEEIINFLRNLLLKKNVPNYFKDQFIENNLYNELNQKIETRKIIEYIRKFNNSILEMKKVNNTRIFFELNIIDLLTDENESINNKILVDESQKKIINETSKNLEKEKPISLELEENIDIDKLKEIQQIRINNTLCNFDKKSLLSLNQRIDEIRNLLLDPKYNNEASLLLDGKLKAVGKYNILFVYDNNRIATQFNNNIYLIDEMLNNYFKIPYKSIAVDINEWNIIKEEFNSKKKQYEYIEETNIDKENDKIETIFENIVEYL